MSDYTAARLAYIFASTFYWVALSAMALSIPFVVWGNEQEEVFGLMVIFMMPIYLFMAAPGVHEARAMLKQTSKQEGA